MKIGGEGENRTPSTLSGATVFKTAWRASADLSKLGGECEIRTHGTLAGAATFQAAGLNHSPNSPDAGNNCQSIGASKPQPFGSLSRSISVQHRCESYFKKIGGRRESRTPKTLSS